MSARCVSLLRTARPPPLMLLIVGQGAVAQKLRCRKIRSKILARLDFTTGRRRPRLA